MTKTKRILPFCFLTCLFAAASAPALEVEIQGIPIHAQFDSASCIEIGGVFPGVKIETSEIGKVPRICYNSNRINSITILNASFISVPPLRKEISVKFNHDFPTGINGNVMARAKLQGFFASPNGIGVPSGDKISVEAFFSQGHHDDAIAEPFGQTVGDDLQSALVDYSVKEQYLISGPRELKGVLKLYFADAGHKLTLAEKNAISIDTGSTLVDKLEAIKQQESAMGEEEEIPEEPSQKPSPAAPASPRGPESSKPKPSAPANAPAQPIPFPSPSEGDNPPPQ